MLRIDIVEPNKETSKTEKEEPSCVTEKTENAAPKRA